MIDIEILRSESEYVCRNLKKRGFDFNFFYFQDLDSKIRALKTKIYRLQYKHNLMSVLLKSLKLNFMRFDYLVFEIFALKNMISNKKSSLDILEKECRDFLSFMPNILHKSVPIGYNESDNLEIRLFSGSIVLSKNFINDLESSVHYIDFGVSAKLSGSGFVVLKSELAQLYRSLGNYMLDLHVLKHGYQEIYSPLMVNEKSMFSTGHLPKFYDDLFNISGTDLWLIPTSEVVLSNLISGNKLNIDNFPLKFVSKTECFRKEKGSYGYKVKGLIRQHQFDKVELVKVVLPEDSYNALEELVFHAEKVLQNLNLSYRVLSLCSKDLGFTSSKTYDLEVWFPKRKMYVEVSSCSNTESFQSIRMKTKFKNKLLDQLLYPHILNGSGLAIGRVFLAIIENYSDKKGNLVVPDVLVQYMNGRELIQFK